LPLPPNLQLFSLATSILWADLLQKLSFKLNDYYAKQIESVQGCPLILWQRVLIDKVPSGSGNRLVMLSCFKVLEERHNPRRPVPETWIFFHELNSIREIHENIVL